MPKVSYSPALPIFLESDCELVNFQTYEPLKSDFIEQFEKYSPNGVKVIELIEIDENIQEPKSLENYIQWAQYQAIYDFKKTNFTIWKK